MAKEEINKMTNQCDNFLQFRDYHVKPQIKYDD